MTTIWITHGDSDDYYGIHSIHGVHPTRELAVEAAEGNANAQEKTVRLEWRGNKLIRYFLYGWEREGVGPSAQVSAEISEHTIEGAT